MNLNYQISGTPNSPALIFSHSLGADNEMWEGVAQLLVPYFQVIRYDTRGHGKSDCPAGEYRLGDLGGDVLALMDSLGIEKAYFCGLSMGGLIGQWLGINAPGRLEKLVISNSAAKIGQSEGWQERIHSVKMSGLEPLAGPMMTRWFSDQCIIDNPELIETIKDSFVKTNREGYTACCVAIRDADLRSELNRIPVETLVITGEDDPVTTVADARFLQDNIPGATLKILKGRHLPATEDPVSYAETLLDFFVGKQMYERGMFVRKSVLGEAHVAKAEANINEFNTDFQEFITKYAWGEIWTRPGLQKRERSMITLAMLIALNRGNEFKMHVKAAFNNGLSKEEIKEVILQSALYCGLPAANEAIHLAEEVFSELGKQ